MYAMGIESMPIASFDGDVYDQRCFDSIYTIDTVETAPITHIAALFRQYL